MFGGLLTGLEALAFSATVESAIEKEIWENKIEALIKQHKGQMTVISNIYEICQKLFFDEGLLTQLKVTQLYSVTQWDYIGRSMNKQIKFINDFMKKFKDIEVKPPDSKFEWLNYFIMAVYSLGFIDKGYKLYKGIKKPAPSPEETPSLEPQMVQENRNMNSENVQATIAQAESPNSVEEIQRNASSSSPTLDEVRQQAPVRSGLTRERFETMKDWGRTGLKFAAEHGVRILFLSFVIINFVKGRIDINTLRDTFKKTQQYFGAQGGFQKKEEHVAIALLALSANIFTLTNLSHSVISELHSIYLTRSAVEPVNANFYFMKATQMIPEKFGLSPSFLSSCDLFLQSVKKACASTKTTSEQLTELEKLFRPFVNEGTVIQVFQDVIVSLSRSIGEDVMSSDLHRKQTDFIAFLKDTSKKITSKRGQDFDTKPLNQKKQIDSQILAYVEDSYKLFIIDDENSELNSRDKRTIVEVLSNFCTKFYATDDSGATVYTINIADNRSKQNYADLLNNVSITNPQGRVPIRLSNKEAQEKQRETMADLAIQVNTNEKVIPEKFSITKDNIEFRYTRVIVRENGKMNQQGQPLSSVIGSQGAQFKYQEKIYQVEQELISKRATLSPI